MPEAARADGPPALVGIDDLLAARTRIAGGVVETPLVRASLPSLAHAEVYLKLETLQLTGSFKARGALNRLLSLDDDERRRGVIAASAGNHAQGVAYGAARLGVRAVIVMPETTPQVKVDRTRSHGSKVEVVLKGSTFDQAYDHAVELQREQGLVFVHPYDDPLIIAGQGTCGLEIDEQMGDRTLDAVVVPIGGGGLISGVATALRARRPETRIFGVQTEMAPAMRRSLEAGVHTPVPVGSSLADGIAVKSPGRHTLPHVQRLVEEVVLVPEADIESAVVDQLDAGKTLVEGSAAAALAAIRGPLRERLTGRRVVALMTGANIDPTTLHNLLERSFVRANRMTRLRIKLTDRPGHLWKVLKVIADSRGNVVDVFHDRIFGRTRFDEAEVVVTLVIPSGAEVTSILAALHREGHEAREVPLDRTLP